MAQEWRLARHAGGQGTDYGAQMQVPMAQTCLDDDAQQISRFCFSHECSTIRVMPVLSDRPVVVKPDKPLYVFSGEETTLYLAFPLWIRVEIGEPRRLLQEFPTVALSDTWFGPNTREGELCYAGKTFGRLHLSDLPLRPYRVITAVRIRNKAPDSLYLERLNINLPMLSLYRDAQDVLWTNALTLERQEGQGMAALEIERKPPVQAEQPQFITGSRQIEHRNLLVRAFSSFLG